MSNEFHTAEETARVAAAIVGMDLGLAGLIWRDVEADFEPGSGKTVNVRVPGAVASQTRGIYDTTTPLVSGELNEQKIPVTLTDHVYDLVTLSEGDMSLEIEDLAVQVLRPQALAIVKHVERAVAKSLKATPAAEITYDSAHPAKALTQVRRRLRENGVQAEAPLFAAVGASIYADLLDSGALDQGDTVRGFKVVESTRLEADEIVGFVKEAFALAVRAPVVPDGAPYGASVTEGDFALRHIVSFDSNVAADRSLMSALVGVAPMPLAVDRENGEVDLVEHGGAVRVITA